MQGEIGRISRGIEVFKRFFEGKTVYVDKTKHVYPLFEGEEAALFLARCRHFGKFLLASMLGVISRKEQDLFKRLWIVKSSYAWNPSLDISLDFSDLASSSLQALSGALNRHFAQVDRLLRVKTGYMSSSRQC